VENSEEGCSGSTSDDLRRLRANKALKLSPSALLSERRLQPGTNREYMASIGGAA
jgi:hypothetical protein